MKKIICSILLLTFVLSSFQQGFSQGKPPKLPMENKMSFENFLKAVYTAYENKDYKALKNYYSRVAGEIGPDGSMIQGMKYLEPSWKAFDAMLDEKPTFTYKLTSSRMINSEIGIITWDSEADIMMKGQQIGGKATGLAVLKKRNDSWLIEFDVLTPVIPMALPTPDPAPTPAPEAAPSGN